MVSFAVLSPLDAAERMLRHIMLPEEKSHEDIDIAVVDEAAVVTDHPVPVGR